MIDYTLPLDSLPDPLPIRPIVRAVEVDVTPPGSKSVTCRVYVLAALADGRSTIRRPLRADDTDHLLTALDRLGAAATSEGDTVSIEGVAGCFPRGGSVFLGDGGAPSRFTIAAATLAREPVTVDGSPRLRERPVADLLTMLRSLGARIEPVDGGALPVCIHPGSSGGEISVRRQASSQFVSAVMLIAPFLTGGVRLISEGPLTSRPYITLSGEVLRQWGASVIDTAEAITIAETVLAARSYEVPPDASSACFWWTAAALVPGARITTPGVTDPPRQPDVGFLTGTLPRLGVGISGDDGSATGPPRLHLSDETIDLSGQPDATMCLGVLASRADRPLTITGLRTLRVKETDRVSALAKELRKLGCTIKTTDESLTIDPRTSHDRPVTIETYNDHRMAMAFAVLGLARPGISITNPSCVAKSYPTFWKDLDVVTGAAS